MPTADLKAAMRSGEKDMNSSLQVLHDRAREVEGSDGKAVAAACASLSSWLSSQPPPYPAWAYLGYYKLGTWMLSDTVPSAEAVHRWSQDVIAAMQAGSASLRLIPFGDPGTASPQLWQALLALFQEGGDFVEDLEPPAAERLEHWRRTEISARDLIRRADPELEGLMAELQSLVVLAEPGPRARLEGRGFGGATCFFFRGGSLLNASRMISPVGMVERLVHEFAHSELFVLGQDQPLCDNTDDERYSVLIRRDPRPMNGILHALHVVSRVAEVMRAVQGAEARQLQQEQLSYGTSALQAIERHAQLTPLGRRIVSAARQRLAGAAVGAISLEAEP